MTTKTSDTLKDFQTIKDILSSYIISYLISISIVAFIFILYFFLVAQQEAVLISLPVIFLLFFAIAFGYEWHSGPVKLQLNNLHASRICAILSGFGAGYSFYSGINGAGTPSAETGILYLSISIATFFLSETSVYAEISRNSLDTPKNLKGSLCNFAKFLGRLLVVGMVPFGIAFLLGDFV